MRSWIMVSLVVLAVVVLMAAAAQAVVVYSENFDALTSDENWTGNATWSVFNQVDTGGPGGPYTSASAIGDPYGLSGKGLKIYAPDGYAGQPYAQWNVSIDKVANPVQTLQYDFKLVDTWANYSATTNLVFVMTAGAQWAAATEAAHNYAKAKLDFYLYGGTGGYSGELGWNQLSTPPALEIQMEGIWYTAQLELDYNTGTARARYGLQGGTFSDWTASYAMFSTEQPTAVRLGMGGTGYFDNLKLSIPDTGVNVNVTLLDFAGPFSLSPIRVTLLQGTTVVSSQTVTPTQATTSIPVNVAPGTYSVKVEASKCLSKTVSTEVTQGSTGTIAVSLDNGDVDGDNSVTTTDLSLVLSNLDKTGN